MQHGSDYMMRQVPTYYDPPQAPTPEMLNYYEEPPFQSQPGNHAHSPFQSTADLANPNFRNAQPSGYAEAPYMPTENPYRNLDGPRNSDWLEKTQKSNRRSRFIVIGSILTLAALIVAGIVLGVVLSRKNSNSSSKGTPAGTNPNDPSNFQKNPALKQSFWGIAYAPIGAQLPECGVTLADVIVDIQLLSQLTTRIRLYGADCNQASLVLEAIEQVGCNMSVWLGNYPSATDNGTAYYRQKQEIQDALTKYSAKHVAGVTVGNELILDSVTQAGENDPNGPAGNKTAAMLISWIQDTRNMLTSLNLGKTIPVGTADAGSYFNNEVLGACDYGMSNVHAWFANQSVENAAAWVNTFFQQTNVAQANSLPNKPHMYIAETGWPTNTSTFNYSPNDGPSTASVANLQIFINTWICQAIANGTDYFFFEFCDQEWQDKAFGGVEGYWGLFDKYKNFKNLTIPDCSVQ